VATQAYGVIGACYGDEGKGRTVDAIAHRLGAGTVVVRSNGGAQAGHTVVAPSGARHVFHQIGSGAFAGAATHFSRFMVSHPMMLAEEVRAVAALGGETVITADPRGFVTTPWDMMVNQAVEMARGGGRHGSCGLGFGETHIRAALLAEAKQQVIAGDAADQVSVPQESGSADDLLLDEFAIEVQFLELGPHAVEQLGGGHAPSMAWPSRG
jgi:adenylosuccinate synthase